ncbi:hypothetical protein HG1_57920 [Bacillus anthracis]|uniref:Uncharacterized protein n=1 Tax=Bacillus anthracis TaxID=1392 RepID=A0A640M8C1_BACAN|nr:hypothetical protein HG1_57920 [Bacillus anthracis]
MRMRACVCVCVRARARARTHSKLDPTTSLSKTKVFKNKIFGNWINIAD